jgi:hypothetical protein
MTPELKEKIRNEVKGYLKENGWPDKLKGEEIINSHLPNIWKHLESHGLLKDITSKGFTYQHFVNAAVRSKQQADMQKAFDESMKGWGFR